MESKIIPAIKVIVLSGLLLIGLLFVIRDMNYEKATVKFCNEQGWGYSSGDYKDRTEIWCGVMTNDNGEYGFDGVTYQVEKKFFGGYKVKDGFDVNLELEKGRFREYCISKCEENTSGYSDINYNALECVCFSYQDYRDYTIKPEYRDALGRTEI